MTLKIISILLIFYSLGGGNQVAEIYQFELDNIDGKKVTLEHYKGKVLLIVNVASKCGFTKQYKDLQKLYDEFKTKGLVILGFPANNFLRQEPGTNQEIKTFCQVNYGVTFPMFSKISVGGKDIHPLYRYLTGKDQKHAFSGRITWNFNKFLIGRDGQILARYPSKVKPYDKDLIDELKKALMTE